MSPARRSIRRRDWPRGLREPRPGYYAWQHPDGSIMGIGRVPLVVAKSEATAANLHVAGLRPSLVERISGATQTVADLLLKMPQAENPHTAKTWRSLDGMIQRGIGTIPCGALRTADCAALIEGMADAGKRRQAQALRSRLMAVCRRGMGLGWMDSNPAEATDEPKVSVQRGRLTLVQYKAIEAVAAEVAEWLPQAMRLAVVTGADRATIAGLQRDAVADGYLTIRRSKTGAAVAIPTRLRLDALGLTLADVLAYRSGVVSRYLIHHVSPWGNAPAGSPVFPDRISKAFTLARQRAGIPDANAPTFHELRSLAKRLYDEQGGVDTKALLGHKTERMSDLYANPRGVEAIKVRVA